MKNIKILSTILILFASLYSGTLKAQNEFAPIGAEWFHDMSNTEGIGAIYEGNKIYYSKVLGDTIIDGIIARHIAVRPYFDDDYINDENRYDVKAVFQYDYYVYNTVDTVFYYNNLFQKFIPLYIFNVQPGDSLRLYPAPDIGCSGIMDSGYFTILIDSVKTVDWGGALLRTVYNHTLIDSSNANYSGLVPHYRYSSNYFSNSGVYVEKLGIPSTGFMPLCFDCIDIGNNLQQPECQFPIALRCYSEPATIPGAISVNMVDTSCDFGLLAKASINKNTKSFSNVDIYPNPVSNTLYLSNLPIGVDIAVFDVMGRKIFSSSIQQSNFKINTESWSQGVYLVQLNYQGERWMEKVYHAKGFAR